MYITFSREDVNDASEEGGDMRGYDAVSVYAVSAGLGEDVREAVAVHVSARLGETGAFTECMVLLGADVADEGSLASFADPMCDGWTPKDVDMFIRGMMADSVCDPADGTYWDVYGSVRYEEVTRGRRAGRAAIG